MRRLGQHFLKNKSVVEKIIGALDVQSEDFVIEIGPGHGELTLPLAEACKKADVTLVAIERDERLAQSLRENPHAEKFEVMEGDALALLPQLIAEKSAQGKTVKLAGNIPYYITGKLLRIASETEEGAQPSRCVFMVQREVAERAASLAPKMNRLAASVQFWADAEIIAHVPKKDFSPPPEVDSAVILLAKKLREGSGGISSEKYYKAVRAIFAQPRKTIANNIAAALAESRKKEEVADILAGEGLDPSLRPQDLSIENISAIARRFF